MEFNEKVFNKIISMKDYEIIHLDINHEMYNDLVLFVKKLIDSENSNSKYTLVFNNNFSKIKKLPLIKYNCIKAIYNEL